MLTIFVFFSLKVSAKNLIISDVDDTIKLANVPNFFASLEYAIDEYSYFTGMNSLYSFIQKNNPDVAFFYVSKAPEWAMKTIHENFLIRAGFPQGIYLGQAEYSPAEHKLKTLRNLIESYHPERVLFIGDNGQQDAAVYAQIAAEYKSSGIQFSQYIHVVYSVAEVDSSSTLEAQQVGFVTSIELGEDLVANGWISAENQRWMITNILPQILSETAGSAQGAVAFPYFMDCQEIDWRWNIPGLNEKVLDICR